MCLSEPIKAMFNRSIKSYRKPLGVLKSHTANHCRLRAAVVCVNERERGVGIKCVGLMKQRLPAITGVTACLWVAAPQRTYRDFKDWPQRGASQAPGPRPESPHRGRLASQARMEETTSTKQRKAKSKIAPAWIHHLCIIIVMSKVALQGAFVWCNIKSVKHWLFTAHHITSQTALH